MTEAQKESEYFYIWKALCCWMILFIHSQIPGNAEKVILVVTRIGVLVFFAISGWYLFRSDDIEQQVKQLKTKTRKTVWLTLRVSLICMIFAAGIDILGDAKRPAWEWFAEKFNPVQILRLFFFNDSKMMEAYAYHLWYLFAMINCYAILYCSKKLEQRFKLVGDKRSIILVLLAAMFFLEIVPDEPQLVWYRNWLFEGLPCILMGVYAKKNMIHTPPRIPIFCGIVLSIAEMFIFGEREIYFGSVLTVLLILQKEHFSDFDWLPDQLKKILVHIGKDLSGKIYCYHMMVHTTLIIQINKWSYGWIWFRSILVMVLSVLLAELLYRFENKMRMRKQV